MADFFGATFSDGRSESSMVDSIMMPILHSAMNRAHDRVRSREGVFQRLAEQSKFCDLAIMQLDACVTCLQSADDDRGFHRETTAYRNLVSDLTEIRDRLLGRLKETERAIADKDKELERLRNWFRNQRSRKEEEKEQLKEDKNVLEEKKKGEGEIGTEINSLKRTLDVAMLVMQNAISGSEVRPLDQQFCWEMEKEIMTTLFVGFVRDFQVRFGQESDEIRKNWSPLGASLFSVLMEDLLSLRGELQSLTGSIDKAESNKLIPKNKKEEGKKEVNKVSLIIKAHESIIGKKSDKLDVKSKETDEVKRSIHGIIKKLDSLSKWNDKVDSLFICVDKNLNNDKENSADTCDNDKSRKEIITREKDELDLHVGITEEIQSIVLKCMMKEFQQCMHDRETVIDAKKSIQKTKMMDKCIEELNLQGVISGGIQSILFKFVMKDIQQHVHDQVKDLIGQGALLSEVLIGTSTLVEKKDFRDNNHTDELNLQLIITGEVQSVLLKCATDDFQQQMHDQELMSSLREVIFKEALKCIIRSKFTDLVIQNKELKTIKQEADELRFMNTIEKQVFQSIILDTFKDMFDQSFHDNLWDDEQSSFIKDLDYLLCYVEEENTLRVPSSDKEKQDNPQFIIQDSEHAALMIEENNKEIKFNSSCDKFSRALEQLETSKILLKDLGSEQEADVIDDDRERGHTVCLEEAKGSSFGFSVLDFFQLIANVENVMQQKLDFNFVRLERLKRRLMQLMGLIAHIRKKESIYRQAFIRRCENLQKAETEVDILGDQVNALLSLLEKIYTIIKYHAPSLQQCSGVLNILTLIKKEVSSITN